MSQVKYRLFGINLISDFRFTSRLSIGANQPDSFGQSHTVFFTCDQFPPFSVDWKTGKLVYSRKVETLNGEAWNALHHFASNDVFQFGEVADFYLGRNQIDCYFFNPSNQELMELYLLGPVLAFWLERYMYPVLHASAVSVDGRIAAFPSHSGNGKSTLAANLLQAGAMLLTDDILPIEDQAGKFWGHPGIPQINLWPDQAVQFLDNNEESEFVFPGISKRRISIEAIKNGKFCNEKQTLACIYIPSRLEQTSSGTDIEVVPLPPAEAVIELVRYSFIPPYIFEKLGWQARRLDFFARLVKQVPVRRLLYPSGFEYLPRVTDAILQDLERLKSQ